MRFFRKFNKEQYVGKKSLGREMDSLCSKYSDKEYETVSSLKKDLKSLEKEARAKGCSFSLMEMEGYSGSPHYDAKSVDEFCKRAHAWLRSKDTYLSIDWIDGAEVGDKYMLCFHSWSDPDDIEECAQFLFEEL